MSELTFEEQNRIAQLENILNELRYLKQEQSVLDAIASETRKGINHIKNNAGKNDFFFPERTYMEEKIGKLQSSAMYIHECAFPSDE